MTLVSTSSKNESATHSPSPISVPYLQNPPGPMNFSISWSAIWCCWFAAIPMILAVAKLRILSPSPDAVVFFGLWQLSTEQQDTRPLSTDTWQGMPPCFLQIDVHVSQMGSNYQLFLHHLELSSPDSHYDLQQSFIRVPQTFPPFARQHWLVTDLCESVWMPGEIVTATHASRHTSTTFSIIIKLSITPVINHIPFFQKQLAPRGNAFSQNYAETRRWLITANFISSKQEQKQKERQKQKVDKQQINGVN